MQGFTLLSEEQTRWLYEEMKNMEDPHEALQLANMIVLIAETKAVISKPLAPMSAPIIP